MTIGRPSSAARAAPRPTVVLLHGLARSARSMAGLRRHLARAGYQTWAHSYPSREQPIAALARELSARLAAELPGAELFVVTHSMGGILARHLDPRALRLRGMVMLAPPNQGSRLARRLHHLGAFQRLYGPAGLELARRARSDAEAAAVEAAEAAAVEAAAEAAALEGEPASWPPPPCPFGVIAGTVALSPFNPTSWLSRGLALLSPEDPSDGTVAVSETRLPAMADFRTVPASHTWIMNHPAARAHVLSFLERGRFADHP